MEENPLRRWMRIRDVQGNDVAKRLGIVPSRLSRLMSGKTSADPEFLAAVAKLTGCGVTPNDWVAWHGAVARDSRQERKKIRT